MTGAQHGGRLHIGDFDLPEERRFRVFADPDWMLADDSVTVSRVHPNPSPGVITATGLNGPEPGFRFPTGWTEEDRQTATGDIVYLWRGDWRASTFDRDLAAHVLPVFVEDRRMRLLLRPGISSIAVEQLHPDGRPPMWAATFYRLGRDDARFQRDMWPLMRVNYTMTDWLGQSDYDPKGKGTRATLRGSARLLWTSTIAPTPPAPAAERWPGRGPAPRQGAPGGEDSDG